MGIHFSGRAVDHPVGASQQALGIQAFTLLVMRPADLVTIANALAQSTSSAWISVIAPDGPAWASLAEYIRGFNV
jgi:hypothetical protein